MDTLTGLEDEEDFFNGYEPALARQNAALSAAELDAGVPRLTSEQLERAGRFRKPVAVLLGLMSALALLGLALQQRSSAHLSATLATVPEAQAVAPPAPARAVTVSLAEALPAPQPDATLGGPPSPQLDLANSPVGHEPTTLSAAFAVMTLAPVRASARRPAVAEARPFRMSSAKPAAAPQATAPVAPTAPAVARFPELER